MVDSKENKKIDLGVQGLKKEDPYMIDPSVHVLCSASLKLKRSANWYRGTYWNESAYRIGTFIYKNKLDGGAY